MAGLADSTHSQYDHHLKDFKRYCDSVGIVDHLNVRVETGIEYLTSLFRKDLSYSTLNSVRAALSQHVNIVGCDDLDFGKHPLTIKFMKGVYRLRPPAPKYNLTWDVADVLSKLRAVDAESCSLKELSLKCVMLLALATGQRVQTLSLFSLKLMSCRTESYTFGIEKLLKTSKPGTDRSVTICRFTDSRICPVTCLEKYISRTEEIRGDSNQLFLSFTKPHKPVSSQSLSRWLVKVMRDCNVPDVFGAHTTRAASTSRAAAHSDINTVLRHGLWKSEKTFAKFYHKPIVSNSFVEAVFQDG
jgi:site-specific recombinase XerD